MSPLTCGPLQKESKLQLIKPRYEASQVLQSTHANTWHRERIEKC